MLTAPVALRLLFAVPALGYIVYMLTYMGVWVVFHRLDPTSIRALFPRTIDDSYPSEPPAAEADFWVRGRHALANAGLFAAVLEIYPLKRSGNPEELGGCSFRLEYRPQNAKRRRNHRRKGNSYRIYPSETSERTS
ncbi:hypothetical protein DIPPA_25647 [Diplonema papillatum]|nr:hypothetical protein DIPPA_25647 [Diplonema papillatum]